MIRSLFWTIVTVVTLLVLALIYYFACINHIEVNEIGLEYDSRNGAVSIQENSGWHVTSPFVQVEPISIQPMKVEIPSAAVVVTTMIVRFRKEGATEFIRMQGFHYNLNSELKDIMRGYAFSSVITKKQFSFLEVLQAPGEEKMAPANK